MKGIAAPNPLPRHGLPGEALAAVCLAAGDGGSNACRPGVANVSSSSASTSSSPSSRARTAAAIMATAALALLSAACSGSPPPAGSGGSSNAGGSANSEGLAFARCVRSHGVPDFPDPNSAGEFNKTTMRQLSASNPRYQTATQACAHLAPNSGGGPTAAEVRQEWNGMLTFARCIRSHGVPNWPDPTPYPPYPNEPTFRLPDSIQPVPQTISKMEVCLRLVPNNQVVGHIDNDNWMAAQQAMAGQ